MSLHGKMREAAAGSVREHKIRNTKSLHPEKNDPHEKADESDGILLLAARVFYEGKMHREPCPHAP
jgi:hypothetical protein